MTTGNVSSAAFVINNMQTGNISSHKTDTGSQFKDVINSLNDTGNTLTMPYCPIRFKSRQALLNMNI